MRLLPLVLLVLTAHAAAQTATVPKPADSPPALAAPTTSPSADPNVVVVRAGTNWWEDAAFDRRVSLVLKDSDLNGTIDALAKATGLSLVASGGSKARKKVSLNLKDAPLRDVMLAVATLYGLEWFKTGSVLTLTYVSASAARAKMAPPSTFRRPSLPAPRGRTRTRVIR